MSKNLFDGSSDSEQEITELKTNKEYAKSYNKFREKELLKRLKDIDGNDSDDSSDDDSDSSEDEAVASRKFDEEFFKTLSSLKSKDPKIYDKNVKFFENVDLDLENKKTKSQKALTIKDYERKVITEKGGVYEDDESDIEENMPPASPTYIEEQNQLKNEFKKALNSDDSEEEEFGGIFRRREKTKEEKTKEEEQYAEWLSGKKEDIGEAGKPLHPLKEFWSNPKLPKQEQFLRDYILNNGYADTNAEEIPTYEEIVGDDNLSEDEKELEKQAEFEQKFNFRFEEPDQEFIKRYPRTIESSVRKTDDRRKQKRVEVKERKLKEKEQKQRELEMIKALKKKEIEEKIQKLKEVTGNEELAFKEEELDDDFDPDAHDRRMKELFNDEYYGVDEGEEKPECDIEELKVEDWDNFDPEKDEDDQVEPYEPHCEDEDFNMDCDYDPNAKQTLQDELIESTKGRRKRKRRNQFMEMIKKEKPAFDPEDEKTYGDYIDEYYKLDYEDIIGDQPCRFKYVETVPNDFGLTIEEILLAKNKELNQWASLKKAVQIRPENVELRERKIYQMKAKNEALKRKIFVSLYGPPSDEENDEEIEKEKKKDEPPTENVAATQKKKKKNKKKRKLNESTETPAPEKEPIESKKPKLEPEQPPKVVENKSEKIKKNPVTTNNKNPFKNNKFKSKPFKKDDSKISDERLKAYGINPRKFNKKQEFLRRNANGNNKNNFTKGKFKNKSKQN